MASIRFETLLYGVEAGIATVILHRPENLNAFTAQMATDLVSAFDATDSDDEVKAVIVTGSGRAFCAGADLSGGAGSLDFTADGEDAREGGIVRDGGGIVTLRIFRSLKPVIAAVNGASVGVGATIQLPMDIRLASSNARYGFVFTRRGVVPEAASSWFLSRTVDMATALEWCFTGRVFDANEALTRGLVRSVHAPDDLLPAARALAREIVDNAAPVSVALTRQLLWRMSCAEHPMLAHRADSRGIYYRGQSGDAREGIASFLEKRKPVFSDRVSSDLPDLFPGWREMPFQ
ncbi:MAG TPA: crotonase/enoyl-CoA hydratase family protein [Steroidobacteraceae bacterium]|jgi:enoyl-CoA hydratase/carnithine racemase